MSPVAETIEKPAETAQRTMTGGTALVEMLRRNGVDTIFGLPGVQLDGFFAALHDAGAHEPGGAIRVLHTRHEQATAYMADGYARVTGKEGVCAVVPGPGLLNATAALSTAYACHSPVLCVTGQIRSDMIDRGRGMLHEIPDQIGMIRHVTKHAARAMTPGEIPATVDEAFRQLRNGRVRPVEIEIPPDTLFAEAEVALMPATEGRRWQEADPGLIARAAKALADSTSPLIYAGGGVIAGRAWDELLRLAELLQAPVVMTRNGKGSISDRHYLAHGEVAELELRPKADVVLAVGTRLVESLSGPRQFTDEQTLIRVDIDPVQITLDHSPTLSIVADAKTSLAALADEIERIGSPRASREDELGSFKRAVEARIHSVMPQAAYGAAIRNALPDDGIVVGEMTQLGYWSNVGLPIYEPNTYLTPGYQGTLGWGFCTALGAKVGKPGTPVVSINGDGGFGFTMNELATMAQHGIAAIALVFNDSAYGNVRRIQRVDLGGKLIASDLRNPDFVKLADAHGVVGRRAESADGLQTHIEEAMKADEPTLIEIPVGEMPNPWTVLKLR